MKMEAKGLVGKFIKKEALDRRPWMKRLFHGISVFGSFLILMGLIDLILKYTVGLIPGVMNVSYAPVVLLIVSFCFTIGYFKIDSPYNSAKDPSN
jgi:hypothetical protein